MKTKKTYVLDTNVLLHDPNSIESFHNSHVVIPLSVVEELDKMKRFTDELGKNARFVIRLLDAHMQKGDIQKGIKMGKGIQLRLAMESGISTGLPIRTEHAKNKILQVAYTLSKKGEDVVVVSKDFVTRTKAIALGLTTKTYLSLRESFDNMYKGMRRIEVQKSVIDKFYTDGFVDMPDQGFLPNEFCTLYCKENSSVTCKYNVRTKHLEPMVPIKRDIWGLKPLNDEQRCALDLLLRDDIKLITLIGQAGTGKTLLALTCGLKKVFDEGLYKKILVSRPIMPLGKDIGFLPGTKEEKIYHWMQPIYDNLEYLCEYMDGDENGEETKKWILESQKIEMEAVTYIRGRSLSKTFIIIDEAQNLTPHEVKAIISRAGKGTKVILTGDPSQIDNPYLDKDSNALTYIVGKFKHQAIYGHVLLERTERSELAGIAADVL